MSDFSPAVARELYPIAVRQARADVICDAIMLVIVGGGCAMLWAGGDQRAYSIIPALLGGVPVPIRSIRRYKRLRSLQPSEAADAGEL
jgi:hypothetical protein